MSDWQCPACGGGFPAHAADGACPWCGESINDGDGAEQRHPPGVHTPSAGFDLEPTIPDDLTPLMDGNDVPDRYFPNEPPSREVGGVGDSRISRVVDDE